MKHGHFIRNSLVSITLALCHAFLFIALDLQAAPADDHKEASRLYQQGKLDAALLKVNGILAAQPKDAQGRFLKGLILTEQKKSDEAIKQFTGLTEDFPELPEPYNNLAVLYASQGNYEKARSSLEKAINTHPSYATAHENLGDIYAQLARRAYDKALQLDKNNITAQAKLAMVKDLFSPPKQTVIAQAPQIAVAAPVLATPASTTAASSAKPTTATAPVAAAATATSSQTATPAATVTNVQTQPGDDAQVRAAVHDWAQAWSNKNVGAYLSWYAPDFETPNGMARNAWEKQRHERIVRPKSISVAVTIASLSLNGNEAVVSLRQTYRSDSLKSQSSKVLRMVKSGEKWLITQERVAG
jgi:tetratricopeptide (TPR) repeat protein